MNDISFNDFGINDEIINALTKLGYTKPTKIQQEVIKVALGGKDLIGKSQTGSGKTAAFGIPICEKIEIEKTNAQALILTPTRELCVQVKEDISNIGRLKRIRCAAVFGKQPVSVQVRELKQRTHVIVGTPGRTLDLIDRDLINVEDIKYLVIDEADEMFNMGFIDQVEAVIASLPRERVTMLFSATMTKEIEAICKKYMKDPIFIDISEKEITTKKIKHSYFEIEENKKLSFLNRILNIENPDSCIIFCRTKENVERVSAYLKNKDYPCSELHGGMLQNDRLEIMKSFKRGEFMFLAATDLAARGIDIENVTHIINFDIPLEKESYVHRIGRTGRAGNKGIAITFVSPNEYKYLREIENFIGFEIHKEDPPSYEVIESARKIFREKLKEEPKLKEDKDIELIKEITKIYINAGKKKKVRSGDIVGALTSIKGINSDDIGIIDIQENVSYIDILGGKGEQVLNALQHMKIKNKIVKAEKALK